MHLYCLAALVEFGAETSVCCIHACIRALKPVALAFAYGRSALSVSARGVFRGGLAERLPRHSERAPQRHDK
jgi:hypothetical protein